MAYVCLVPVVEVNLLGLNLPDDDRSCIHLSRSNTFSWKPVYRYSRCVGGADVGYHDAWSTNTQECLFSHHHPEQNPKWKLSYCWWKISCTGWYGIYPVICRVSYMSGGAGFLPSTVVGRFTTIDGWNPKANHLRDVSKPHKQWGRATNPQLVTLPDFWLPSTVSLGVVDHPISTCAVPIQPRYLTMEYQHKPSALGITINLVRQGLDFPPSQWTRYLEKDKEAGWNKMNKNDLQNKNTLQK